MQEIRTSGSMSGDGKRSVAAWPKLPRPSSTLPKLRNARALVCPEELAKADMRPFRRDSAFDPSATSAVHCGNGFDAGFSRYQTAHLSRYDAVS
jgi:hypothetical protein